MSQSFTVACVQMTSGPHVTANVTQAVGLVREAHRSGAQLIVLPELINAIERDRSALADKVNQEQDDTSLATFCALAAELRIWLLVGSLSLVDEVSRNEHRTPLFANRSFMIGDDGVVRNRYSKNHLFESEEHTDRQDLEPGRKAVLAETPWGPIGMTIGSDVYFAQLYRQLAQGGARYLSVPAALAGSSGKAHWHVLARARAIESGCFVFAAAQCGDHGNGRMSYGHALIVDPRGTVLADGGQEPGFILAEIDPGEVEVARSGIPPLTAG